MARFDRVILHIGKHKTGTSSIQASLFGVDADGFRYADLPRANHNLMVDAFARTLMEKKNRKSRIHDAAGLAARREAALAQIEAAAEKSCRTLMFSGENMSLFDRDAVAEMVGFFRRLTDRIEVYGFVRAPISGQTSTFAEIIKHGYGGIALPVTRYRKTFEPYIEVLGPDAVHILEFDPRSFRNGSLVETFMHAIGEDAVPYEEQRRNEGLAGDAIRFIYLRNQQEQFPIAGRANRLARRKFWKRLAGAIVGPKLKFPDICHNPKGLADEVAWLKAAAGIDFSADLARIDPDPVAADAAAAVAETMAKVGTASLDSLYDLVEREAGGARPATPVEAVNRLYRACGGRVEAH